MKKLSSRKRNREAGIAQLEQVVRSLRLHRPKTKRQLKNYIMAFLGLNIPDKALCQDHNAPLNYLWHSFNADFVSPASADSIVWANRGGGKTELAAVATLLDLIFKPECQIRILAGSGDQAHLMYNYLTGFLQKGYGELLAGPIRKNKCRFKNNSAVEVLTQSHTSVRGQHVQKLRCDEVELFKPRVFAAAKFTTMGTKTITAAMEIISTMHKPYGLMHKIVNDARNTNSSIFKWCLFETIEKCTDRNCSQCPLNSDCHGKAKKACGYLKIDDCIAIMQRSSRAGWESEMLCKRPSLESVVFDLFDTDINAKRLDYNPDLPLYRSIDFGFVNPFVCLWIQTDTDGNIYVIDEYYRSRASIETHADEIKKRTPVVEEKVAATFCDPAGAASNQTSGSSPVSRLKSMGIRSRFRKSSIIEGIELIRSAICSGDNRRHLFVSQKCPRLIEALQCYHYPEDISADKELPLKDGVYDHPIDALRYFFINHVRPQKTIGRRY